MSAQIIAIQLTKNDEKRWNNLLLNSVNTSYKQSMSYEYVRKDYGREIETFIFKTGNLDVAGVHYSIKRSQFNFISTADVLSGFVFSKEPDAELLRYLLEHFINWAKQKKASYSRITPWLPKLLSGNETVYNSWFSDEMKRAGFKPIVQGRHTYWIDLSLNEEQLMANMKRQTRYEVRQGIKSDLVVKIYDEPDNELFEKFWNLYNSLGKQKGFNTLSKARFKDEVFSLMEPGLANLFVILFHDKVVNISFSSNFGQAAYLHGAINPEFKRIRHCPSPGPLAQWEMIMYMKAKGLKIYDMGFCPGAIPIKEHPQYYIWRFKYGFGGYHVEFLPTYGKPLYPIRGRLFQYLKYRK